MLLRRKLLKIDCIELSVEKKGDSLIVCPNDDNLKDYCVFVTADYDDFLRSLSLAFNWQDIPSYIMKLCDTMNTCCTISP